MLPKVSIIVPVYNVQKFIARCVDSLLHQDYPSVEIILVDDGSPDDSGKIIDQLKIQNPEIIVIHKTNGGVSSARNAGINRATGKYIMFVDGDDWVEEDYVSYFVELLIKEHTCIGMGTAYYSINKQGSKPQEEYCVSAEQAMEWIYSNKIFVAVWNKIYDASIVKTVLFNENIWFGEGMLFNIECLQMVDLVSVGTKMVYHQTFNTESAMRSFNLKSHFCGIASLWLQRAKWKKYNAKIENAWKYHRYRFNRSILEGIVRSGEIKENKDVVRECISNIRKDILMPVIIEKNIKQKIIWLGYFFIPKTTAKVFAYRFKKAAKKYQ